MFAYCSSSSLSLPLPLPLSLSHSLQSKKCIRNVCRKRPLAAASCVATGRKTMWQVSFVMLTTWQIRFASHFYLFCCCCLSASRKCCLPNWAAFWPVGSPLAWLGLAFFVVVAYFLAVCCFYIVVAACSLFSVLGSLHAFSRQACHCFGPGLCCLNNRS